MPKLFPPAVAFGLTAVVFSATPRAEECAPNNLGLTCSAPQIAYQSAAPTPHFVPLRPAPDRYPGPALQSENGGSDSSGGGSGGGDAQ